MVDEKTLTNSRMACFKTCPRKHMLSYEVGLRPIEDSKPLYIGTAFHECLDLLAKGEPEGVPSVISKMTDFESAAMVHAMVDAYAWRWSNSGFEVLATEKVFEMAITNPDTGKPTPTFVCGGKIDKIVKLPDGRQAIMDHKTASADIGPGSDYWRRLRLDQQVSLYVLGARSLGYPIETVVYDVVRKPGIKPRGLTKAEQKAFKETRQWFGTEFEIVGDVERETPAMYGARAFHEMTNDPERYFQRMEVTRTDADMLEYEHELWQTQQAIRDAQKRGLWFRNSNACVAPYRCQYLSVCSDGWKPGDEPPPGFRIAPDIHPELMEAHE